MKIIACYDLDAVELSLNDLSEDQIVVDPDTYHYFRDTIFIKGITNYIKKNHPKFFLENVGEITNGTYHHPKGKIKRLGKNLPAFTGDAAKVERWYDTQYVIGKYYREYDKKRQEFYHLNGFFYSFVFLGFANVGNEIQLSRYDLEDVCEILNSRK